MTALLEIIARAGLFGGAMFGIAGSGGGAACGAPVGGGIGRCMLQLVLLLGLLAMQLGRVWYS